MSYIKTVQWVEFAFYAVELGLIHSIVYGVPHHLRVISEEEPGISPQLIGVLPKLRKPRKTINTNCDSSSLPWI